MYDQISQHINGSKSIIKVLVITSNEKVGVETAYKFKNKDGKIEYKGFMYDIFLKIKENLKDKYYFDIYYTDPKDQNYDDWVKQTAEGKYDLVVGGFFLNLSRNKQINYTSPLFFNAYSIITYRNQNNIITILRFILSITKPLVLLIFIGFIFGLILYLVEPNRGNILKVTGKKKYLMRRRTILSAIASFFGEMGFLSENSTLSLSSIITVIIIMIVAFIIVIIAQAKMTSLNLSLDEKKNINLENLDKYNFLGFEGNSEAQKLDKLGANVTYLKNMTLKEGIDYYIKNKNTYNGGLITVYTKGMAIQNKNKSLNVKYDGLGLEPSCWITNKNKINLLDDINKQIVTLIDNGDIKKLCKKYILFKNACIA